MSCKTHVPLAIQIVKNALGSSTPSRKGEFVHGVRTRYVIAHIHCSHPRAGTFSAPLDLEKHGERVSDH